MDKPKTEIRPQPGPQERFAQCNADIAVYGGAAGGGKSFGLLLEPLYHVHNKLFQALLLRRTLQQLKASGGLVDTSERIYAAMGATLNRSELLWRFKSGATLKLGGMEYDANRFDYQGTQVALLLFDELNQFSAVQFWYMLSRLRSVSGVRGYVRAATNPDPDSWVRKFLDWWIDNNTGVPIPERDGVLRWFVRDGDELRWFDDKAAAIAAFGPECEPKSATYIRASVYDNRILLATDKAYLSNLKALARVDREQLLNGNWNARASAGAYFRREWFEIVDAVPGYARRCRFWDRAATPKTAGNDPDATVGARLAKDKAGVYYIEDVRKMFATPLQVDTAMRNCAGQDGVGTMVAYSQDPGSAGVNEAQGTARVLDGFYVKFQRVTGDKESNAKLVSAQAEAGNVKIVRAPWNDEFIRVLENFPDATHDDEVDALSGAYNWLNAATGAFTSPNDIKVGAVDVGNDRRFVADRLEL